MFHVELRVSSVQNTCLLKLIRIYFHRLIYLPQPASIRLAQTTKPLQNCTTCSESRRYRGPTTVARATVLFKPALRAQHGTNVHRPWPMLSFANMHMCIVHRICRRYQPSNRDCDFTISAYMPRATPARDALAPFERERLYLDVTREAGWVTAVLVLSKRSRRGCKHSNASHFAPCRSGIERRAQEHCPKDLTL